MSRRKLLIGAALLALPALGLAGLLFGTRTKRYRVPSGSMIPALKIGQRVQVARGAYTPEVGDIVVFHPPTTSRDSLCAGPRARGAPCRGPASKADTLLFIKRVVALPGDRVALRGGRVIRNGAPDRFRIVPCGDGNGCDLPVPVTLPRDAYYMVGDNRGESDDSRFWGAVRKDWIVGPVVHCGTFKFSCPKGP